MWYRVTTRKPSHIHTGLQDSVPAARAESGKADWPFHLWHHDDASLIPNQASLKGSFTSNPSGEFLVT